MKSTKRALILNAGAGSGKTTQLAYKYISDVVNDPSLYRRILAVTFTNKATDEMKTRILNELRELSKGGSPKYMELLRDDFGLDPQTIEAKAGEVLSKILHDYSHFTVLTIDKFFQRIMRAFIRELGIDLDYNIELETSSILAKSTDTLIEQITVDDALREWLSAFARENIENGHRWDIRAGILTLGSEIFKESNKHALESAPAKEELQRIVGRIAARADEAREQLRRSAEEAMAIMERAGIGPEEFSGKSTSFAHYFRRCAEGQFTSPTATVRKRAASTEGWYTKNAPAAVVAATAELQPLLERICRLYDEAEPIVESGRILRERFRSFGVLADLYAKVREVCEQENSMILSETKYMLSQLIADNDAPFIYEKVGNRFERLMIDEFQDTSAKEWSNFLPLLHNAVAQADDTSVFIVGDIKQSIYRWRGGDWRILADYALRDLKDENTEVRTLGENFRSLPCIVRFNNDIIERIVAADNAALDARIDAAAEEGMLSAPTAESLRGTLRRAYEKHDQKPRREDPREGYVRVETFAAGGQPPVTECIEEALARGYKPSDIMILVRVNSEGVKIAKMLLQYKNDHPECSFDVMTHEALIIGSSPVVGFIIAVMKLAVDPSDSVSRAVCNNFRNRPVDTPADEEQLAFLRSIRLLSPEEAFERIVMHERLQNDSSGAAYMQALHEQLLNYCAGRVADIPLFIKWWEEQGCTKSLSVEQSESTIEIITVHKAKGLEKPVVIIPYCDWDFEPKTNSIVWASAGEGELAGIGDFPVSYTKQMGESFFSEGYYREKVYAHVDNMNILYVALTRAGEELYIYIPQNVRSSQAGALVLGALAGAEQYRRTDSDDASVRYEYGSQAAAPARRKENRVRSLKLDGYPSSEAGLHLRLPSQRYFGDNEDGAAGLSPRDMGIMMHRAFEQAATRDDIFAAVERMRADGVLNEADARQLCRKIERELDSDAAIRSWFSDEWDEVRTEADIIMPHTDGSSHNIRRPDRVMIRGERAVVVDYKFGSKAAAAYRRQMSEYMRLLRDMGYSQTEGYIWYVAVGQVEKVEA